jgi:hypothetical protein
MDSTYCTGTSSEWNYIGIDEMPPSGKIHVLTEGGISIIGNKSTPGMVAWAPLMKRNKEKEALLLKYKDDKEALLLHLAQIPDVPKLAREESNMERTYSFNRTKGVFRNTDEWIGNLEEFANTVVRLFTRDNK